MTLLMQRFAFLLRLPVLLFIAHVFVAWRLASALPEHSDRWFVVVVLSIIYLLMMAGFQVRDKVGLRSADTLSWAGFLMLGLFSWLFVLTVLRELLVILVLLIQSLPSFRDVYWMHVFREYSVPIVMGLSVFACLWGLINARRTPSVIDVNIAIKHLPVALDGFRIVQITDLHVGPTIKKGFVQRIINATNNLNADVIVLTGDLVDGSVERLRPHTEPLSKLNARHGAYAVTGNHEYYVGAQPWVDELERLGITVLMNQHEVLEHDGAKMVLAGVTDFGAERFDASHTSDPASALRHVPEDAGAKILLAHQPRSIFAADSLGVDLQLSGHTHGGQYWPWGYFVPLQQPFVAGLYQHKDMQIYVSRGTGYWGPPLRLGARSEITHIRLYRDG